MSVMTVVMADDDNDSGDDNDSDDDNDNDDDNDSDRDDEIMTVTEMTVTIMTVRDNDSDR